jgi:hypothetical protein
MRLRISIGPLDERLALEPISYRARIGDKVGSILPAVATGWYRRIVAGWERKLSVGRYRGPVTNLIGDTILSGRSGRAFLDCAAAHDTWPCSARVLLFQKTKRRKTQ